MADVFHFFGLEDSVDERQDLHSGLGLLLDFSAVGADENGEVSAENALVAWLG